MGGLLIAVFVFLNVETRYPFISFVRGEKNGNSIITGTVTDTLGNPLTNILVYAMDATQEYFGQDFVPLDSTGIDGKYTIQGIQSGTYKILAASWMSSENYVNVYYDAKLNWVDADTIFVSDNDTVSGIDFKLRPGAKITGRVSRIDTSYTGPTVYAVDANTGDVRSISNPSSLSKSYIIKGLPPGTLKIFMLPPLFFDCHAFEWYNDKDEWSSAEEIIITASNDSLPDIDFEADVSGHISGSVWEADSVTPVEEFMVEACIYWGPLIGWHGPYGSGYSGRNEYTYSCIRTGNYKVRVTAEGYRTTWYDGKPDTSTADWVYVSAPDTTKGINFYLEKAGVEEESEKHTKDFTLNIYPNPASSKFLITYSLPQRVSLSLAIYNICGERVKEFDEVASIEGNHIEIWDGRDVRGKLCSNGIYFCCLKTADLVQTKKMLLIN